MSPKGEEKMEVDPPEDKQSKQEDQDDQDDDQSSSSDTDEVAAEPLATTRSRRSNAGNRMSKMIQDEEDEFYANLYGGFHEEEDDVDFDSDEGTDAEEDYNVDSDFSIDETDEIAPEHQAVDDEPKRKRGVYKDPKPKGIATYSSASGPSSSTPIQPKPKASSSATPQSPGKNRGERSFRDSTRKKTEETIKNVRIEKRRRKKVRNLETWKPLTQDELLAEAKITEEENLKSLETYQRLESERLKKIKQIKKTLPPPYVTYLSSLFPVIGEDGREIGKYSRNFLTFVE